MSLSDRRKFLTLLAAAPLAACGFTPVYGPNGAGAALRGQILTDAPDTRLGFELVSRLEARLGRADNARYVLSYSITTSETGFAITGTNDITRYRVSGEIDFTLTEIATGDQLLADSVSSFTAYSTTSTTVATAAAERDAEDRLMALLADQMVTQLLVSASRWQ